MAVVLASVISAKQIAVVAIYCCTAMAMRSSRHGLHSLLASQRSRNHPSASLQPLAGMLVSLWRAEQEWEAQSAEPAAGKPAAGEPAAAGESAARPPRRQSLVAALNRQAALTSDVLLGLLEAEVGGSLLAPLR